MRISDWSSDVCSSDLRHPTGLAAHEEGRAYVPRRKGGAHAHVGADGKARAHGLRSARFASRASAPAGHASPICAIRRPSRSEEHTSELQSLMRLSYAVFCLIITNSSSLHFHDLNTYPY